jgi:hypothetical protein
MLTGSFVGFARKAKPAARQLLPRCRAAGLASQANSRTTRHTAPKAPELLHLPRDAVYRPNANTRWEG